MWNVNTNPNPPKKLSINKITHNNLSKQGKSKKHTDLGRRGTPWHGRARGGSIHPHPLPVLAGAAEVSLVLRSAGGVLSGRAAPGWGGPWWSSHTVCSSRHTTLDWTCCPASASAVDQERRERRCEISGLGQFRKYFSQLHLFLVSTVSE